MNKILFLFVETDQMNISDIYDRLLSIMVPKLQYIEIIENDTVLKNVIVVKTELSEREVYCEIRDILPIIGYYKKFALLSPIDI
jgi:hypothetical protein